jgi:hypothetical protein
MHQTADVSCCITIGVQTKTVMKRQVKIEQQKVGVKQEEKK